MEFLVKIDPSELKVFKYLWDNSARIHNTTFKHSVLEANPFFYRLEEVLKIDPANSKNFKSYCQKIASKYVSTQIPTVLDEDDYYYRNEMCRIADVVESHWRGAGLKLESKWIIDSIFDILDGRKEILDERSDTNKYEDELGSITD